MTAGPPPGNRGSDIPGTGGSGVHLLRELPLSTSVLWHPTSPTIVQRKPPSGPYPVFFEQKAIAAVHAHYETAGRQGMMGFLVGDLFESPTSHQRFVVVDQTIRLNQAVYGDKTLVIVSRLWDRIQDELQKTEGHLIGWYHSHPPITVELAPGDVETHLQYFKRPWHVALVLASEHEGPVAGLFRPKPGETSASLPFYEQLEEVEDGTRLAIKQSVVPWINFLTDDQAARHADGSTPLAVTPPPSPSALQFVKATPTPKPVPAPPAAAPKPAPPPPASQAAPAKSAAPAPARPAAPAKPAAPAPSPPAAPPKPAPPPPAPLAAPAKPAAAAPAAPAAPPKPAASPSVAPAAPVAPAASAQQRPPAAPASTTATTARPSLAERPQAPVSPPPPAPPSPPRRDSQMKSPPNALSNLPIVESGGYQLGDVDSRASEPGVVRPRAQDAPPAEPQYRLGRLQRPALGGERPITPKPFAPALVPRADGHPGLVAFFVMAVIAGGGFAGWKYWWLPNHPPQAAPTAAAPSQRPSPPAATPDSAKRSGTSSLATGLQPAATPPVATDSPLVVLDRRADSVTTGVSAYTALVQAGRSGCDGLSQALVAMEDSWKSYNIGKRRVGTIEGDRFVRDERLYAAVDSVERDFDRSGCTRP